MVVTAEYLIERHAYWRERLGREGIWNPEVFGTVKIVVRPKSKNYNALFQRRYLASGNGVRRLIEDRIVFYHNESSLEPEFVDSVLVHEMIHQYIHQGGFRDTSAHGHLFREFMQRINASFPGELVISIRSNSPAQNVSGPGRKEFLLVMIEMDDNFYCCKVNPKRKAYITRVINGSILSKKIQRARWYVSNDIFFENQRECRTRVSGVKRPIAEMDDFIRRYSLRPYQSIRGSKESGGRAGIAERALTMLRRIAAYPM